MHKVSQIHWRNTVQPSFQQYQISSTPAQWWRKQKNNDNYFENEKNDKNTSVVNENEIIKFTRNYRQFFVFSHSASQIFVRLLVLLYVYILANLFFYFFFFLSVYSKRNKMLRMQYDRKDGTFNGKTFMFEEQGVKRYNCHRNAK